MTTDFALTSRIPVPSVLRPGEVAIFTYDRRFPAIGLIGVIDAADRRDQDLGQFRRALTDAMDTRDFGVLIWEQHT